MAEHEDGPSCTGDGMVLLPFTTVEDKLIHKEGKPLGRSHSLFRKVIVDLVELVRFSHKRLVNRQMPPRPCCCTPGTRLEMEAKDCYWYDG